MAKIHEDRSKITHANYVSGAEITGSPDQLYKGRASTDVSSILLVVRPKHETLGRREAKMFLDGLARAYLEHARLLVTGDVPDLQQPDALTPTPHNE